jgi:hypothetical protein
MGLDCLDGIAMDELTLGAALTVGFEDVDVFDMVLRSKHGLLLNGLDSVDYQICEEDWVCVDEFAGHGGLGAVEEGLVSKTLYCDCEFVLDVSAGFTGCYFVASDDVSWVDLEFNEFVGAFK